MNLDDEVELLRASILRDDTLLKSKKDRLVDLQKRYKQEQSLVDVMESAKSFLDTLAKGKEEEFRKKIQSVVQFGLDTVFGKDRYCFAVQITTIQNRRSMAIGFLEDPDDPTSFTEIVESHGGSVVEIVAYFLQVSLILFSDSRPVIFADEKFSFVDDMNSAALTEVINKVADSLGVQVILVTHESQLAEACKKRYSLIPSDTGIKVGGVSQV